VAVIIEVSDLPAALQSDELVEVMVDGANAKASRVAPCLAGTGDDAPTDDQIAEAKLVLIGAVKRWSETAAGSFQSQTAGPFGVTVDTRQKSGFNLWPSEIEGLQDICASAGSGGTGRAFEIDTMPDDAGVYGTDYWWSTPTDRATF
jgi:hypothetical protein